MKSEISLSSLDVKLLQEYNANAVLFIMQHLDDISKNPAKFVNDLVNDIYVKQGTDILNDPSVFTGVE